MRLRRLILDRYGHFADREIVFSPTVSLHVIHGPNEAGKSTCLRAVTEMLFGFEPQTPAGFRFGYQSLRIGAELERHDGVRELFWRVKRNQGSLRDADDNVVPEVRLQPYLGGAGRDLFLSMFGLDCDGLRTGGREILEARGNVGESLFQASAGLHGLRRVGERLSDGADRLYAERRGGNREYSKALDGYEAARRQIRELEIGVDSWRAAQAALAAAEISLTAVKERAALLAPRRQRIERQRRTAPLIAAAADAAASLDQLPAAVPMPVDAECRRQGALVARAMSRQAADGARRRAEELAAELATLPAAGPLDDVADLIKATSGQRVSYLRDTGDRLDLARKASLVQASAENLMQRLRPGATSEAVGWTPDEPTQQQVRRLITIRERIRTDLDDATKALTQHEADHLAALAAAGPGGADPEVLRRTINDVRRSGDLDRQVADAEIAATAAAARLSRRVLALPLFGGDPATLARTAFPGQETVAQHRQSLASARQKATSAADALANAERAIVEQGAALRRMEAGDAPPTGAMIADARAGRDAAWIAIKTAYQTGQGASDRDGPATLDRLIDAADRLADRRLGAAERAASLDRARLELDIAVQAMEQHRAASAQARGEADVAQATWLACWDGTGIAPLSPDEMADWIRDVAAIRDEAETVAGARAAAGNHQAALRHAQERIGALLAGRDIPARASLSWLLTEAEVYCEALTRRAALAQDLASLRRQQSDAQAAWADWAADWSVRVQAIGLPETTTPDVAEAALDLWRELAGHNRDAEDLASRIHGIDLREGQFRAAYAALCVAAAPDLAATDAVDGMPLLDERLARHREARNKQSGVEAELAEASEKLSAALESLAAVDQQLADLRVLACVDTDDAVEPAIRLASRRAALELEKSRNEREALAQGDGLPLSVLRDELQGIDPDALAGELALLAAEQEQAGEASNQATAALTTARLEVERLTVRSGADQAEQDRRDHAAEMRDIIQRYARLRVADLLLRRGIERFRRDQEGPLLRRASAHFETLTGGRHVALAVDVAGGKMARLVSQPAGGGPAIAVDALSEGTRDQLYLAIRLAAIEHYARHGEGLPFAADDLLVNFDEPRSLLALRLFADLPDGQQVILFTHHAYVADLAAGLGAAAEVHRL